MVGKTIRQFQLSSWDNWFPLTLIAVFVVLGAVVAAASATFGLQPGDVDQFRGIYIDVGLQTTAGIFAIVISLSLVAIQFAAQEYSHHIMDYYIKSVMFWSTVVVYLGLMIACVLLNAGVSEGESLRVVSVIMVASVLALVPHFLVTASYLKPEFIIGKLLLRVDEEYLRAVAMRARSTAKALEPAVDRLLPAVELIERSIDRGDLTTTRRALEQIHDKYMQQDRPLDSTVVDRYFLDHVLRIGRKAVAQPDEQESTAQTIDLLGRMGVAGPTEAAADHIDVLGFAALRRDAEVVVRQMIDSLRLIMGKAPPPVKASILNTYGDLAGALAGGRRERLLRHLTDHLLAIAREARSAKDTATVTRCLDLLETAGHDAAVNGIVSVVARVAGAMQELGTADASDGNTNAAHATVLRLLRVERALGHGERGAIASLEFAKGEIERALGAQAPAPEPSTPGVGGQGTEVRAGGPGGGDGGMSDLWSEA